ncbi:MAG: M15 family metallopeptidase [Bacteroidetes bacterium]|nr:M15 family metallopeptidase [Bacteroidota bacterium]
MVTAAECLKKWGEPSASNPCMTLWDVPTNLEIGVIPKKIYCNKLMVEPLSKAFTLLVARGLADDIKTWDGCFNIRKSRGLNSLSLHSWGIAIDIDAFENGLGKQPKLNPLIVACFKEVGFDWGGDWVRRFDGMHFQLSKIN